MVNRLKKSKTKLITPNNNRTIASNKSLTLLNFL